MSQMLFDQHNEPSGFAVSIDNVKTFNYLSQIQTNSIASGTFTPNLALGGIVILNITANAAITIAAPINLPVPFGPGVTAAGLEWTMYVQNKSGGSFTTQPAFAASPTYRISGLPAALGNNAAYVVQFLYDGTSHIVVGSPVSTAV